MNSAPVFGILHPGAMGSAVGAALVAGGAETHWVAAGRSEATRDRAATSGLTAVDTLNDLTSTCDVVISVCPPAEAVAVATAVFAAGFRGTYVDANAIAPATARAIGDRSAASGAIYVDGGIVGPPPRHRGLTVLYLSGPAAAIDTLDAAFADSALVTHRVAEDPGAASAVKMAFAAWTKGTSALLLAIRALAEAEGVTAGLDHAWATLTPELTERLPATVAGTVPKAWRFAGEMEEIATTFADAGLPGGFHAAAAEIYAALAEFRDRSDVDLAEVLERLASPATD